MKGIGKQRRRTALSWLFVAGLFVLCGVLGVLQYGWIGEVSVAARDRLRGAPVLSMPSDRPRPATPTSRGGIVRFALDESLTRDLEALSRAHGVTLAMTLTAAYALFLGRMSGQEEVVIGMPIANRTHVELEGLITNTGRFAVTLTSLVLYAVIIYDMVMKPFS